MSKWAWVVVTIMVASFGAWLIGRFDLAAWWKGKLQKTPDIQVAHVELTQAVQDDLNQVPLVAGRSLAIRVFLKATHGGNPVAEVTVRLSDGATVFHDEVGEFPVPGSWAREDPGSSMTLELKAPTGIPVGPVDVEVSVRPAAGGDVDTWKQQFTFVEPRELRVRHTRIDYGALGPPLEASIAPGMADAFLRGTYPVLDDDSSTLYAPGFYPVLEFDVDENANGKIDDAGTEIDDLLLLLNDCRQKSIGPNQASIEDTFHVYAWVDPKHLLVSGAAPYLGRVGWGTTDPLVFQRTMAHEIGHNLGFPHPTSPKTEEIGWDVGKRLAGNPPENELEETKVHVKVALKDFMNGGSVTRMSWVRRDTYLCLLGDCAGMTLVGSPGGVVPDAAPEVAVVAGILDRDGDRPLRVEPVFRYGWPVQPTPLQPGLEYRVVLSLDDDTTVEATFDGRIAVLEGGVGGRPLAASDRYGFFSVLVPVPSDREIVSLELDRRVGSGFAPIAEPVVWDGRPPPKLVLDPLASPTLRGRTPVSWTLDGGGPPVAPRPAQVAFSPDGGASWAPVGGNLGAVTSVSVDASNLPPTAGQGILRVHVSDGLRTTWAEHTGLTVTP